MRKFLLSLLVGLVAGGGLAPNVLAQGGMLAGTVTDSETGEIIVGATITLENPEANPPMITAVSNDQGVFTLLGANSGPWSLTVTADGYHPNPGNIVLRQGRNPDAPVLMDRIKHPLELALGPAATAGLDIEAVGAALEAADAAYDSQDWETALSGYDATLEQIPTYVDLHLKRGNTLQQMTRYEEAIEAFQAAATAQPGLQEQVDAAVTRLRMAMGDYEAAGELAATAGGSREDLYNLGEVEFGQGNIDAAAEWYEKSSAVDPNWVKPLFKLALVALNKGDIATAKQFFAQVVEKDPNSEEGAQAQATLAALP